MPTAKTLGQLIAVERTLRQRDNDVGTAIKKALAKETNTLGAVKIYLPDLETAPESERVPAQHQELQLRVEDELDKARKYAVPAIDTTASKDMTNTEANADVILDGEVFLPEVPVSHLLWLEHYLAEWRGFLSSLPVRSPTRHWEHDPEARLHKSRPEETIRTVKKVLPLVLHGPTDKHPAQTTTVTEDIRIGKYETTVLSGAISEARKRELVDRCSALEVAVKDAVARANRTPVTEVHEGDLILGYILGR